MAEPLARELEAALRADDLEARAAEGAVPERASEHSAKFVAANDGRPLAVERNQLRTTTIVASQDVDAVEAIPDASPFVGVQGGKQLGWLGSKSPLAMRGFRRTVVGEGDEVRQGTSAPDLASGARVAAAVGVENDLGGGALEKHDLPGRSADGLRCGKRP